MDIYNYHSVTCEFLSQSEARPDPLSPSKYLIPSNATTEIPPVVGQDEWAVFDEGSLSWVIVPDHRGKTYYRKDTGEPTIIADLGATPNTVTELVPTGFSEWDEGQGQWVTNDTEAVLDKMKACNREAKRRIDFVMPDWMNRRHREQQDLVTRGKRPSTKLPEAEYELKQEQCDAVRDASDTINDWIEAHPDPASITNDEIVNHIAWP